MDIRATLAVFSVSAALAVSGAASSQPVARNYDKGPVTLVQTYRVAPGKLNAFMQDYAVNQIPALEIGKKVGGILSYSVTIPVTRGPGEPNLYSIITFKNLASYDRSYERADQTAIAVYGSLEKAAAASAKRAEYATFVSSQLLQDLTISK